MNYSSSKNIENDSLIYPYKKFYLNIDELVYKAINYKPIFYSSLDLNFKSGNSLSGMEGSKNRKFQKYKNGFFFIITKSKRTKFSDGNSHSGTEFSGEDINDITDYFTEHCRVSSCRREYNSITPFEYFNKHKIEIATALENNGLEINFQNLNAFMEKKIPGKETLSWNLKFCSKSIPTEITLKIPLEPIPALCSNYKLTYLMGILNHFKPKRWLDMSAGWGDRLCSAYIYQISKGSLEYYYGIDPSECLNSGEEFSYNSIMEYFRTFRIKNRDFVFKSSKSKSESKFLKAYIHKGPAETSPLLPTNSKGLIYPELKSYDFIFTSPPFFTFEIYGVDNLDGTFGSNQSTDQYNTIDLWLNNFLFKTIDRSWELLEKNGNYLMYIEDKPEYRFIDKMLKFMKTKKGCIYDGIIYQAFYDSKYPKNPYVFHTVYCFRKI